MSLIDRRSKHRLGRVTLRYDPYDEEALEASLSTSRALARLTPAHQIELTL